MAIESNASDSILRLANQLQTLSEVAETLTFRLLELEDRLTAQELNVLPLLEGQGAGFAVVATDTELRLGDTEDRLARLESLLSGLDSTGSVRRLRPVGTKAHHTAQQSFEADAVFLDQGAFQDQEEQPFLEDQPFLDELSA